MPFTAIKTTFVPRNYLYNGKEFQNVKNLNSYDYGARMYDPALGRWHSVNPLAENNFDRSVYHFKSNNPINRIDIDVNRVGAFAEYVSLPAVNVLKNT